MQGLLAPSVIGRCRSGAAIPCVATSFGVLGTNGPCPRSALAERICRACPRQSARRSGVEVRAVAEVDAPRRESSASVTIDNKRDTTFTVVCIEGYSKPGLLTSLSGTFRDLGLDVGKVWFEKPRSMHHVRASRIIMHQSVEGTM